MNYERVVIILYVKTAEDIAVLTRKSKGKTLKFLEFRLKQKDVNPSYIFEVSSRLLQKTGNLLAPCKGIWNPEATHEKNYCDKCKDVDHQEGHVWSRPCVRYWMGALARSNTMFTVDQGKTLVHVVELKDVMLDVFEKLASKDEKVDLQFRSARMQLCDMSPERNELLEKAVQHLVSYSPESYQPDELYMVLNCEPRDIWMDFYEAFYVGKYRQPGQWWKVFKIHTYDGKNNVDNIFPTADELKKTKGILISGSCASVYDTNKAWIAPLCELVQNIHDNYPNIKLVGICFGHQLLAYALGGEVRKMIRPADWTLPFYFIVHVEKINLVPEIMSLVPALAKTGLELPDHLKIYSFHGDEVCRLPAKASLLGTSTTTDIEMFTVDGRILGMQGHPEFNHAFMDYYLNAKTTGRCADMMKIFRDRLDVIKEERPSPFLDALVSGFLNS